MEYSFEIQLNQALLIISFASNGNVSRSSVTSETMPAGNLRICAVDIEFLAVLVIVTDVCCNYYACIQKAIICYIEKTHEVYR